MHALDGERFWWLDEGRGMNRIQVRGVLETCWAHMGTSLLMERSKTQTLPFSVAAAQMVEDWVLHWASKIGSPTSTSRSILTESGEVAGERGVWELMLLLVL